MEKFIGRQFKLTSVSDGYATFEGEGDVHLSAVVENVDSKRIAFIANWFTVDTVVAMFGVDKETAQEILDKVVADHADQIADDVSEVFYRYAERVAAELLFTVEK